MAARLKRCGRDSSDYGSNSCNRGLDSCVCSGRGSVVFLQDASLKYPVCSPTIKLSIVIELAEDRLIQHEVTTLPPIAVANCTADWPSSATLSQRSIILWLLLFYFSVRIGRVRRGNVTNIHLLPASDWWYVMNKCKIFGQKKIAVYLQNVVFDPFCWKV